MRKLIFIATALMLVGTAFGQPQTHADRYVKDISYANSGNKYLDPVYLHMLEMGRAFGGYPAGDIFYVDGNMENDDGDGKSWATAFALLSTAMAASHADIAVSADREWASRNVIYVRSDEITEDITTLAQKTDIIGVGSNGAFGYAKVTGAWVVPSTTSYPGCHFYNMQFVDDGAGGALFDVDGQAGLEFHGCYFQCGATDTVALKVSECSGLRVVGNRFGEHGSGDFWSVAAIQIDEDTDGFAEVEICYNIIESDAIGIDWNETTDGHTSKIYGNFIRCATYAIDEECGTLLIYDNTMITTARRYQAIDFNVALASNNTLTHSAGTVKIPYDNTCAGAIAAAQRGAHGRIFYCDNNHGANTNDGMTWETPYQNMATALAAADTHVSSGGYACERCTVYYTGDEEDVDQVLLAEKTDLVGVAAYNANSKAGINGTWVVPNAVTHMGFHVYNMYFYDTVAAGKLWDVDGQSGLQFHDCVFECRTTDTTGLEIEDTSDVKVINCEFTHGGANHAFSTAAIHVTDGGNASTYNYEIRGNYLCAEGIGILWDEATSCENIRIADNHIMADGMIIDTSDTLNILILNNTGVTELAEADGTSYDFDIDYAAGNIFAGNDEVNTAPLISNTNE